MRHDALAVDPPGVLLDADLQRVYEPLFVHRPQLSGWRITVVRKAPATGLYRACNALRRRGQSPTTSVPPRPAWNVDVRL